MDSFLYFQKEIAWTYPWEELFEQMEGVPRRSAPRDDLDFRHSDSLIGGKKSVSLNFLFSYFYEKSIRFLDSRALKTIIERSVFRNVRFGLTLKQPKSTHCPAPGQWQRAAPKR